MAASSPRVRCSRSFSAWVWFGIRPGNGREHRNGDCARADMREKIGGKNGNMLGACF
jgi:hypothetical protein